MEREIECILFLHFEILRNCFSSLRVWSFLVCFFFFLFWQMPVLSHHCYRCPVLFNDLGRVHLFKKKKAKLLKVKFKCHLGKAGQFLSVFFFSVLGCSFSICWCWKRGNGKRCGSIKRASFKSYVKTFLDTASSAQQLGSLNFSIMERGGWKSVLKWWERLRVRFRTENKNEPAHPALQTLLPQQC